VASQGSVIGLAPDLSVWLILASSGTDQMLTKTVAKVAVAQSYFGKSNPFV
jgi:hypothetical protein